MTSSWCHQFMSNWHCRVTSFCHQNDFALLLGLTPSLMKADRTSPHSSHLKPIPPISSHLFTSASSNRFNGHLITFRIPIIPLLQHLLHLLIPVTHLTSVKCLKMSEQNNWSVSKWSTHIIFISSSHPSPHLISPVVRGGHLPAPLFNNNNKAE